MPFVGTTVVVSQDAPTSRAQARRWTLREPLVYDGNTDRFTVPTRFETDFASVPRPFVWLLPRTGLYTRPAILHDYLGRAGVVSRVDGDGIFRRAMAETGVSWTRRWMMWAAVRAYSLLREPTTKHLVPFLLVAPPALAFVAVPGAVVQVALLLFWVIELAVWVVRRLLGHRDPVPHLEERT